MAPSRVTRSTTSSNVPTFIKWLFFDAANTKSMAHIFNVPSDSLGLPLEILDWAAKIRHHFRLEAVDIGFWKVGN